MTSTHHLKKRGRVYYVRLQVGGSEQWIATHQRDRAAAIVERDRILASVKRERTSHTFARQILEVAKKMVRRDLTSSEVPSVLAAIERQAVLEILPDVEKMIPVPPLPAADLWRRYETSAIRLKPATFATKKQRVATFLCWSEGMDMRTFSKNDALRFLKSLQTGSANTVKNYISDLASVWKLSPDLPDVWTPLRTVATMEKTGTQHKRAFTLEDMRKVKTYIDGRLAAAQTGAERRKFQFWQFFMVFTYYTFARLIDVVHFSSFNVRADGFVDFAPRKTETTTAGRRVSVRITPQLRKAIDALTPDASGNYFPEYIEMYRRSRQKVDMEFTGILRACGFPAGEGYGTHSMRHGGITLAIDEGNAAEDVAAVAGHAVKLTTGTYYHGSRRTGIRTAEEL